MLRALAAAVLLAAPPAPVLRFSPRPNRAAEIHWRAFGKEAFAEAARDKKPLFLDLSAVWCHWCHVLDETTLSDPAVIKLLNERFVAMRVDADQNPQVERRYMMGGWPTTAFLADDGSVLTGGTYLPPDRFLALARRVAEGYGGDREALRRELGGRASAPRDDLSQGKLDPRLAEQVGAQIRAAIDPEFGGLGGAPKFPHGPALALLGYLGRTRGDAASAADARATLLKMGQGEIFDRVEGGFFRYATERDWSKPHYEKMLAGNAEVLLALAETYAATRDEALRPLATSAAGYLVSHLWDEPAGAFYGSQDADEVYYRLDAAGRAARKPPYIDRTFLTDRIALAARALIRAGEVLEEPSLCEYGVRAVEFLRTRMRAPGGLLFHTLAAAPGATPGLPGQLGDQAQAALAALDAAGWTGDDKHLRFAQELLGAVQRELGDPAGPGFFDQPASEAGPGLTAQRLKSFDENTLTAWALLRLGEVSANPELSKRGAATLTAFAGRASGAGAADFARAAELAQGRAVRIAVVGPRDAAATKALLRAAARFDDPRREVRLLDASKGGAKLGAASFPAGAPAAYACTANACSPPIRDADKLAERVSAFVAQQLER